MQLLNLTGPLRGLPRSQRDGDELRRVPGNDPGRAGRAATRIRLTGHWRADQEQVDVTVNVAVPSGRRAEHAPVSRLGVPGAQRAPEPLPQRQAQRRQRLCDRRRVGSVRSTI